MTSGKTLSRLPSTPTMLVQPSDTAELVEKLEDAQMALGSMASNRFVGPFREEVSAWLGKLGVISEQVQKATPDDVPSAKKVFTQTVRMHGLETVQLSAALCLPQVQVIAK